MITRNKQAKVEVEPREDTHVVGSEFINDSSLKYEKPVLIAYGDVRDITLGGSPGIGESGALFTVLEP